jgi:hypothetical protein
MLNLGGKNVVYSRSFIMGEGETAVLSPPELFGARLRIETPNKGIATPGVEGDFEFSASEGQLSISCAFLSNGAAHAQRVPPFATLETGSYGLRIARQSIGVAMLVHVDVFFEPNQKAPKTS